MSQSFFRRFSRFHEGSRTHKFTSHTQIAVHVAYSDAKIMELYKYVPIRGYTALKFKTRLCVTHLVAAHIFTTANVLV